MDVEAIALAIAGVYEKDGEAGLILWMQDNGYHINWEIIDAFGRLGVERHLERLIRVAVILAECKKNSNSMARAYFLAGLFYYQTKDYLKSIAYFNKALPLYLELYDNLELGHLHFNLGNNYYSLYQFTEAIKWYSQAIVFYQQAGELNHVGESYLSLVQVYSYISDFNHVIDTGEKAMAIFQQTANLSGQGELWLEMAWAYFNQGALEKVWPGLEKSMGCFRESANRDGQCRVYLREGKIYLTLHDFQKTQTIYQNALPFFEQHGDPERLGNLYQQWGVLYHGIQDYTLALETYQKARSCYQKIANKILIAEVDVLSAGVYLANNEVEKGLELMEPLLDYYESTGNALGIANVDKMIGDTFLNIGAMERVLALENKALSFYERVGDRLGLGNGYSRRGRYYFFCGELSSAMEMYVKALLFLDEQKDFVPIGGVYHGMGNIYMYRGDMFQAFNLLDKAMAFFDKASFSLGLSDVVLSKGHIFSLCGATEKALDMYQESLEISQKEGNLFLSELSAYISKAKIFFTLKDNTRALEMYDNADALLSKVSSPWAEGWIDLGKALIYLATQDYAQAGEMATKGFAIFKKLGYSQAYSRVYEILADIHLNQKQWSYTLTLYDQALQWYQELGDLQAMVMAKFKKASALLMLEQINPALTLMEEGFSHLEKMRTQVVFSQLKNSYMEELYRQVLIIVDIIIQLGYARQAFLYTEQIKARLFLDQLGEGLVKPEKDIPADLLQQKDELEGRLSLLTKKMVAEKKGNEREEITKGYQQTEAEYNDLLIKIRLTNPLYASVRYPKPVSIPELQGTILHEGEILLRYLIPKDAVYVFVVSTGDFHGVTLDVHPADLEKMVNGYLKSVRQRDEEKIITYGKSLYKTLIKPLENVLKKTRDIWIAPDGVLVKIPFESLVISTDANQTPRYLLELYRIKYIQSASVLAMVRQYLSKDVGNNDFIGFGDPVYDYENFIKGTPEQGAIPPEVGNFLKDIHLLKYQREGGDLNRLEASSDEIETIAGVFKKYQQEAEVYLRAEATEEQFKGPGMKEFAYIHMACHGILGAHFQGLVLSQIPGAEEDGFLTLNDFMNCDLKAKLVVLSACQSALGKMGQAEGVTGLTNAMMIAGTPAVVASLWNVSDLATKELMITFYTHILANKMNPEEALRQAKLTMIKNEIYASPYFWGPFVMYGE